MKIVMPILALCLAGCDQPQEPVDAQITAPSSKAPLIAGPDQATAEQPAPPPGPPPPPSRPPGNEPQPGDLAPCPGINPDIRRPAGSNCLGVTPDECGADLVQKYIGKEGTRALRYEIAQSAKGRYRWIEYMQAVTDDLDNTRMNVMLDDKGRIEKIDCF